MTPPWTPPTPTSPSAQAAKHSNPSHKHPIPAWPPPRDAPSAPRKQLGTRKERSRTRKTISKYKHAISDKMHTSPLKAASLSSYTKGLPVFGSGLSDLRMLKVQSSMAILTQRDRSANGAPGQTASTSVVTLMRTKGKRRTTPSKAKGARIVA